MNRGLEELPVTGEQLEQLSRFDTPTIVNALDSLSVSPRSTLGPEFRALTAIPGPMVGIAITGLFREQWGERWAHLDPWLGFLEAVEATPFPVVAVLGDVSAQPGREAMIGEGMARAMRAVGAVGAICDGPIRDIQALRHLEFPVIGRGLTVDRGQIRFWRFNVPAPLGQMSVEPFSLIHADENGAVAIPVEKVTEVLSAAARVSEKEAEFFREISDRSFTVAKLRGIYDRLLVGKKVPRPPEPAE